MADGLKRASVRVTSFGYNRKAMIPWTSGMRLGPYVLLAPIGAGGMGEVWKARDTRLDRMVAIKLKGHNADVSTRKRARSRR